MAEYHVFIKRGDALAEIDRLVQELRTTPEAAGLHKALYVSKAAQTVAMLTAPDAPLARALRERKGWTEPEAEGGH